RNEPGRRAGKLPPGDSQETNVNHQHHDAEPQYAMDYAAVAQSHAVKAAIEEAEEPTQAGIDRAYQKPAEQTAKQSARREIDRRFDAHCRPTRFIGADGARSGWRQSKSAGQELRTEHVGDETADQREDPPRQSLALVAVALVRLLRLEDQHGPRR